MQVLNNYVFNLVDRNNSMYQSWSDCNHIWLGALIFLLVKILLSDKSIFNKRVFIKILDFSDKYSYEGYLVHQFMILGPLSLIGLTNHYVLDILIQFEFEY